VIKAVIFDMDGLLIDSEPLWRKAQTEALKTVGVQTRPADFKHVLGVGLQATVEFWYHQQPWKGASLKDIEALITDDFVAAFKREGKLRPGVHQVLDLCKAEALPMAIASSTFYEVINMVVDTLEIRDYFEVIYSAEHEPYAKPHPGVFISTAALLNVEPRQCLVFEDAPAGVLAAKAARMFCVAVPEPAVKAHPFIRTADIILGSLEEFDRNTLINL
jgi:sugar-phosphatase